MKHTQTIVLTGGGSGGHITPLLSLAHAIKAKDPSAKVVYIGHRGDKIDHHEAFDKSYVISGGKFRRYHGESLLSHLLDIKTVALNIRDIFRIIFSVFHSFYLISRIKPNVVFSKGSFVAVPVGVAAKLRGIPIITHDSDAAPGLANKIIGRWAALHATGMPTEFYRYPKNKMRFTGIPVNPAIKEVSKKDQANFKAELKLPLESQVLLVAGGGNGAVTINNLIETISTELLSKHPHLYILHFTGLANEKDVVSEYGAILSDDLMKRVKVIGFTNDFYKYSAAADVIISRAGATSIAEFAIQAKPVIVIPSPFLANGHQLKNADQLFKADAAVVVDNSSTGDDLLGVINELLSHPERRSELSNNISNIAKTGAAEDLAQILLDTAKGKEV